VTGWSGGNCKGSTGQIACEVGTYVGDSDCSCEICEEGKTTFQFPATTSTYCVDCPHGKNEVDKACVDMETRNASCGFEQQNEDFLGLLTHNPPFTVNSASDYDHTGRVVPEARGLGTRSALLRFPPQGATVLFQSTGVLAGTMAVSGAPAGNGVTTMTWSSESSESVYQPFNLLHPDSTGVKFGTDYPRTYDGGIYIGDSFIQPGYKGDWFKFKSPECFAMQTSRLRPGYDPYVPDRSAAKHKIYAKNLDSEPWIPIFEWINQAGPRTANAINVGESCYFQYAVVVNTLQGDYVRLELSAWIIEGTYIMGGGTTTGKYDLAASNPSLVTTETADFNAVNPVTSLYAPVGATWAWPARPEGPYTRCWTTRNSIATDWKVACFTNNPPQYVVDQQHVGSPDEAPLLIHPDAANHLHALYTWDTALTTDEMKTVTSGLRAELGGVPQDDAGGSRATHPIHNLRAYYLRLLIALRPPQSINIFADITPAPRMPGSSETRTPGSTEYHEGATVPNRMGPRFEATVTQGTVSKVTTTGPGNGAVNPLTSVVGSTGTKIHWPEKSLPMIMTICSVTRYMPGTKGRILASYNFYHGHVDGKRGIAGYRTTVAKVDSIGSVEDWLIMCGNTGNNWPGNVVIDQLDRGVSNIRKQADDALNINDVYYQYTSDYNVHSVYIWDVELSSRQMKVATTALRAQLGGTPDGPGQDPVVPMGVTPAAYCAPCRPGTYFLVGQVSCTECPVGTSNSEGGQASESACGACPMGAYQDTAGQASCRDCPAGTYQNQLGQTSESSCIPCPTGTYQGEKGQFSCSLQGGENQDWECRLGWTRELDRCVPCLAGTEGGQLTTQPDTRNVCRQCALGTFKTNEKAPEDMCEGCPTGTYSATTGAAQCTDCPQGQSTLSPNSVSIDACTCGTAPRRPVPAPPLLAESQSAVDFYASSGGLAYCMYHNCP